MEMEMEESPELGKNKVLKPESFTVAGKSTQVLFVAELKKICYIALPMVVVSVSENLLRFASMSMVGHLGKLELAGTAIATSLTNVTGFSILFGMASALETLCGQAYGAGQFKKLGAYTYAGVISLLILCLPISISWIFMDKLLILIGQDPSISTIARKYSLLLIPTLFPYAILQLLIRYLQSQSLILPMLWSSVVTLLFHIPICWALVFKLGLGSGGAALAICISYTLNVIMLWIYVSYSSTCEKTRLCFSAADVLPCMHEFFQFGIPSAGIISLEWWTFEIVILLAGLMPNPQLTTSVLSIWYVYALSLCEFGLSDPWTPHIVGARVSPGCVFLSFLVLTCSSGLDLSLISLNISAIHYYIPSSFGAAASTRVSNELGAGNPNAARMAVWAAMAIGLGEQIVAGTTILSFRNVLGYAFGTDKEVLDYVSKMAPFLCVSVMVDSLGGILCGVARGSGWQHIGAYITLGAYYLAAIPMALLFGFVLHLNGRGLWVGIIVGVFVQAVLFAVVTCFTDWQKQATMARERIFEGVTEQTDDDEKSLLS